MQNYHPTSNAAGGVATARPSDLTDSLELIRRALDLKATRAVCERICTESLDQDSVEERALGMCRYAVVFGPEQAAVVESELEQFISREGGRYTTHSDDIVIPVDAAIARSLPTGFSVSFKVVFFARDSSLVSIFACAPGPTPVKSITELESTQIAARAAVGLIMDAAVNGAVYWETRAETRLASRLGFLNMMLGT